MNVAHQVVAAVQHPLAHTTASIPVSPGFTPTFYGVLTLIVVQTVMAWIAWTKGRPAILAALEKTRSAKRAEDRTDLSDCHERLNALENRLNNSEEARHQFEIKLVETLTAYRILDAEVFILAPNSPALAQARAVLSQAYTVSPSTPSDMKATVLRAV